MATNVPAPTFTDTGFVAPLESAILAGVQADQNAAFGGNLNPSLSTPQGQLAQSEAAIIGDRNDKFLALANGVDPAFASGRMQDAIGRIYFIERMPATATVVTATCSGLTGVTIPAGALAVDQGGLVYSALGAGTIPADGSVDIVFQCLSTGPNACPIGYLNGIYKAIPGWDSVTNAAAGIIGSDVESRADFEFRRANSVAKNSRGSVPSVRGAVLDADGVLDAYVVDNPLGTTATIGGYTLKAHSLYVAAYGGTDQVVAEAIWSKKAEGCDYNGNTTVVVYDTEAVPSPPYPEYNVTFQRPAALPIKFSVSIRNNTGVPSNALALIQGAIQTAFFGADGGQRARIGVEIFASRFYAGVAALGVWAKIIEIKIGTSTATLDSVTVRIDQIPTVTPSDIALVLV